MGDLILCLREGLGNWSRRRLVACRVTSPTSGRAGSKLPAPNSALTAECTSFLGNRFCSPQMLVVSGPVLSWTHSTRTKRMKD